jgi:hypothetical protein
MSYPNANCVVFFLPFLYVPGVAHVEQDRPLLHHDFLQPVLSLKRPKVLAPDCVTLNGGLTQELVINQEWRPLAITIGHTVRYPGVGQTRADLVESLHQRFIWAVQH